MTLGSETWSNFRVVLCIEPLHANVIGAIRKDSWHVLVIFLVFCVVLFHSIMAHRFAASLILSGLSIAQLSSSESLQPCGEAFYYPSKVQDPEPKDSTGSLLKGIVYMLRW